MSGLNEGLAFESIRKGDVLTSADAKELGAVVVALEIDENGEIRPGKS